MLRRCCSSAVKGECLHQFCFVKCEISGLMDCFSVFVSLLSMYNTNSRKS